MGRWLGPSAKIGTTTLHRSLVLLVADAVCSQAMATLTGGAFLVAYVLSLGGSNFAVGLVSAVSPLSQLLQLPAALLIDRVRLRKALTVASAVAARLLWFAVAAIPWLGLGAPVPVLLGTLALFFGTGALTACGFNTWMRDLVPERVMSGYFARRLAVGMAVSAVVGLAASAVVDRHVGTGIAGDAAQRARILSALFGLGGVVGLVGAGFLSGVAEPRMPERRRRPLRDILREPLDDRRFRRLLVFLGSWSFAANLAAPFFIVYMLRRLGLPTTVVVALSVVSQLVNALFLRIWGRLADQFGNAAVLGVSGGLFLTALALWPMAGLGALEAVRIPLLAAIHLLLGVATAGITLCSGTIALKLAPRGEAAAYLATNALVSGVAASVAPLLAGLAADWLDTQRLTIELRWTSTLGTGATRSVPALDLHGIDFLFVAAFVLGLYAIHRLLAVREEGQVDEAVVRSALVGEVRRTVRDISNVPGIRQVTEFPYAVLGRFFPERRRQREGHAPERRRRGAAGSEAGSVAGDGSRVGG
jgi:MFS family permease